MRGFKNIAQNPQINYVLVFSMIIAIVRLISIEVAVKYRTDEKVISYWNSADIWMMLS